MGIYLFKDSDVILCNALLLISIFHINAVLILNVIQGIAYILQHEIDFFCIRLTSLNLYLRAQRPFVYITEFLIDYSCIRTIASRLPISLNLFCYRFTDRHIQICHPLYYPTLHPYSLVVCTNWITLDYGKYQVQSFPASK